ncbi:MAG TPA: DTW domain-containing protein [Candidatus Acidoferrum sp.]|nr:DTW domain-containing protein [Candidatus Acidoferrum sp.]
MRSVVRKPSPRCSSCLLSPRWCVCAAQHDVQVPLSVAVLSHQREFTKPSSTGNLIKRLLPASVQHRWDPAAPLLPAQVVDPHRELWILHPHGEELPATASADRTQVLLLDGAWLEASSMVKHVKNWGRPVRLPMQGKSRFWLRSQQSDAHFSTIEALLFLLQALGLQQARTELQLQFELHVYAGLRARGRIDVAAEYLATSPIRTAMAEYLLQLHARRPNDNTPA